jgi:4-aminobutyrate aminotransferase-like enzyme
MGLMQGAEIVDPDGNPDGTRSAKLTEEAEKRGLLLLRCGPHGKETVRWLPPLLVSREQIDEAVGIFEEALKAVG